ncbi:hypothetical protein BU24DRAFT_288130 [Aaosphaeria arxii CBS 175.79]|uniref:Uncharacterized protein n=1 Tax=Aaosphaeria arxii CBS 175.79 TaxID=1450172 RepID=A0A6A5XES2_9PLEO|nr:uncharacterized protein BU24DRAFT_288130 [Aaosphaeria arxii CBS 175.79]KAF2011735.1 hypothetical protein BU24DRAFT_288130 [Aaosphaeria arxii CBS 175.79]
MASRRLEGSARPLRRVIARLSLFVLDRRKPSANCHCHWRRTDKLPRSALLRKGGTWEWAWADHQEGRWTMMEGRKSFQVNSKEIGEIKNVRGRCTHSRELWKSRMICLLIQACDNCCIHLHMIMLHSQIRLLVCLLCGACKVQTHHVDGASGHGVYWHRMGLKVCIAVLVVRKLSASLPSVLRNSILSVHQRSCQQAKEKRIPSPPLSPPQVV